MRSPDGRPPPGFWSRLRRSRLTGVLVVYLGASWLVVQVANELRQALELPEWVSPVVVLLLLVGLVVVLATAWVQSHPLTPERAAREEVPDSWELDLGDLAGSIRKGKLPHLTWSRALLGGLVAFSLLFGFAGVYVLLQGRGEVLAPRPALAEEAGPGVAVLPFSVRGRDLQQWREGMVDLLTLNLDGAGGLRAIDSRTVLARWRERVPEGREPDLATALEVARATGAAHAVIGTLASTGESVRLTADIRELPGGRALEPAQVDGPADSLIPLVDRLSGGVLRSILERSGGQAPGVSLASVTTASFRALREFLEGEAFYRRAEFGEAIQRYERAVAADPGFALAWYRLGLARGWAFDPGVWELHEAALEQALRYSDQLPRREATIVRAALDYLKGLPRAGDSLRAAVQRYPDDPEAWYLLGEAYFHWVVPGGQEESRNAFKRAVELDPGFAPYQLHLLDLAFDIDPDSAVATSLVERYGRLAPGSPYDRVHRTTLALAFGDSAIRAATMNALDTMDLSLVTRVAGKLSHPRFWPRAEGAYRLAYRRAPDVMKRSTLPWLFIFGTVRRGRLARSLEYLGDPLMPEWARTCAVYQLHSTTGAIPDSVLEATLGPAREGPPAGDTPLDRAATVRCAAQYAAERGRWAEFERLRSDLGSLAGATRSAGDTAEARRLEADDRWLVGWESWKRGRREEALARFEEARQGGAYFTSDPPGHWWMGQLLMELGRPTEALPFLRVVGGPLPRLFAARAYEAAGDLAKAREEYEFFLRWWEDADPELQPLVDEARQALTRIAQQLR